jgi:hypothetical protein
VFTRTEVAEEDYALTHDCYNQGHDHGYCAVSVHLRFCRYLTADQVVSAGRIARSRRIHNVRNDTGPRPARAPEAVNISQCFRTEPRLASADWSGLPVGEEPPLISAPFLYEQKGSPAEYKEGLDLAINRGCLVLHESETSVKFTQMGAELFA